MNQGMVAFIDGKFTNASAHTSYLYLVKELLLRLLFATAPARAKAAARPFRFAAPEDSFSESAPGLGGPPIIY